MNGQHSSEAERPNLDEQLVAYLDGELDADESRRIEETLAADPTVRRQLQQLERSWELMDRLPRAEVDDGFVRTTVEMIAVQAEQELDREQAQLPRRRRRAWLLGASGLLAAAAAGFVLVTLLAPGRNDELLENLPIVENLEQYRQTEDIEFLRMLRDEGVFAQEDAPAPIPAKVIAVAGVDTLAERSVRIDQMDPAAKEQLERKYKQFAKVDPAERERLRALREQIEQDPDRAQLEQVMRRYTEWLSTLTSLLRAELAGLEPAQRVEKVKEIRAAEARESSRGLSHEDATAFAAWFVERLIAHEDELRLPRHALDALENSEARDPLLTLRALFWPWGGRRGGPPSPNDKKPGMKEGRDDARGPRDRFDVRDAMAILAQSSEDDLAALASALSRNARGQLLAAKGPEERQLVFWGWFFQALRRGPSQRVSENELLRFFDQELTEKERQNLLNLSGERMQRELRNLYFFRKQRTSQGAPPNRPDGPPRGPDGAPADPVQACRRRVRFSRRWVEGGTP